MFKFDREQVRRWWKLGALGLFFVVLIVWIIYYPSVDTQYATGEERPYSFKHIASLVIEQVGGVTQFTAQALTPFLPPTPDDGVEVEVGLEDSGLPVSLSSLRSLNSSDSLVINVPLSLSESFEVKGTSVFASTTATSVTSDTLTVNMGAQIQGLQVSGQAQIDGTLLALNGILTRGTDVDLNGGLLFASNVVNEIIPGDNVTITGSRNSPIISFEPGETEEFEGVMEVNGESGDIEIRGRDDISVRGLTIENSSTLLSVRSRGGCSDCLIDSDIKDDLTVIGGRIDGTIIGSVTPSAAYVSTLSVGNSSSTDEILTVFGTGTSTFGGTVNLESGCFSIQGVCVTASAPTSYLSLTDTPNIFFSSAVPFANSGADRLIQSANFVFLNDNLGIGTSSPTSRLTVAGDAYITGAFRDSTNTAGSSGMVLQTTGTSTRWVATSTLGFPSASSVHNAVTLAGTGG